MVYFGSAGRREQLGATYLATICQIAMRPCAYRSGHLFSSGEFRINRFSVQVNFVVCEELWHIYTLARILSPGSGVSTYR